MKNNGGKLFLAFTCAMLVSGCLTFKKQGANAESEKPEPGFEIIAHTIEEKPLLSSHEGVIPAPHDNVTERSSSSDYTPPGRVKDGGPIISEEEYVAPSRTPQRPTRVAPPRRPTKPVTPKYQPPVTREIRYVVVKGDSFWKIARKYGVSTRNLADHNGLSLNKVIKEGDVLILPPGAKLRRGLSPVKPPKNRKSTKPSGRKPSKTLGDHTPKGKRPIPTSGNYVVKKGDSLWLIAIRFGISMNEIKRLNNMTSDTLRPGKVLSLRSGASSAEVEVRTQPEQEEETEEEAEVVEEEEEVIEEEPEEEEEVAAFGIHTIVDSAETIETIASLFAVSVQSLRDLNPNVDWDNLKINMEIKYPGPK